MSDKLMSTAPGGESTQYESIDTVNQQPSKQEGQMGQTETQDAAESGDSSTEEGQGSGLNRVVSEKGAGGHTTTSSGEANVGVGYGGTAEQQQKDGPSADGPRKFQGGDRHVDKTVGG